MLKKYLVTETTDYETFEIIETNDLNIAKNAANRALERVKNGVTKKARATVVEIRTNIRIDSCGCECYDVIYFE